MMLDEKTTSWTFHIYMIIFLLSPKFRIRFAIQFNRAGRSIMPEIRQTFITHGAKIVSAERDPFYPRHSLYQNFLALQRHSNKLIRGTVFWCYLNTKNVDLALMTTSSRANVKTLYVEVFKHFVSLLRGVYSSRKFLRDRFSTPAPVPRAAVSPCRVLDPAWRTSAPHRSSSVTALKDTAITILISTASGWLL